MFKARSYERQFTVGHLRVTLCLYFKRNPREKPKFDYYDKEHVGETHFHMNGFAGRLGLMQRQKTTRKWPILECHIFCMDTDITRNFSGLISLLQELLQATVRCAIF